MNKVGRVVLSVLLIAAGVFVCLYLIWLSVGILRFFGSVMELGPEMVRDVSFKTFGSLLFYAWSVVVTIGGIFLILGWIILIPHLVSYPVRRIWRVIWRKSKEK